MKKVLFIAFIVALAVVNYLRSTENIEGTFVNAFSLSQVESMAGCEVSSNASENKGYCVPNYGSEGDSCVQKSDSDAVRCSKNL